MSGLTPAERKAREARTVRRITVAIAASAGTLSAGLAVAAADTDRTAPLFGGEAVAPPAPVAQRAVQEEYQTVVVHVPAPTPPPEAQVAAWTAAVPGVTTSISRPVTAAPVAAPAPRPVVVSTGSTVPAH